MNTATLIHGRHPATCSGCPVCNPEAARLLGMDPTPYSAWLSRTSRVLSASGAADGRTLHVASTPQKAPDVAPEPLPYSRAVEKIRAAALCTSAAKATLPDAANREPLSYTRAVAAMGGAR